MEQITAFISCHVGLIVHRFPSRHMLKPLLAQFSSVLTSSTPVPIENVEETTMPAVETGDAVSAHPEAQIKFISLILAFKLQFIKLAHNI